MGKFMGGVQTLWRPQWRVFDNWPLHPTPSRAPLLRVLAPQCVSCMSFCFARSIRKRLVSNQDAAGLAHTSAEALGALPSSRTELKVCAFTPVFDIVFLQLKWFCHSGSPLAIQSFWSLSKGCRGEWGRGCGKFFVGESGALSRGESRQWSGRLLCQLSSSGGFLTFLKSPDSFPSGAFSCPDDWKSHLIDFYER